MVLSTWTLHKDSVFCAVIWYNCSPSYRSYFIHDYSKGLDIVHISNRYFFFFFFFQIALLINNLVSEHTSYVKLLMLLKKRPENKTASIYHSLILTLVVFRWLRHWHSFLVSYKLSSVKYCIAELCGSRILLQQNCKQWVNLFFVLITFLKLGLISDMWFYVIADMWLTEGTPDVCDYLCFGLCTLRKYPRSIMTKLGIYCPLKGEGHWRHPKASVLPLLLHLCMRAHFSTGLQFCLRHAGIALIPSVLVSWWDFLDRPQTHLHSLVLSATICKGSDWMDLIHYLVC